MKTQTFDVIIIGGGVAGISAALWCDELGLNSLLIESSAKLGGQLLWTYNSIKNHLGIEAENGLEMQKVFTKQIQSRNFKLKLNSKVIKVDCKEKCITLDNEETLTAKNIILATGISRRKLNIPGENRFINKGILKSGKRDKDLVKGKSVLIVGGGDAAFENTIILSEKASKIYLAHRQETFRARDEFVNNAMNNKKVTLLKNTILREISGNEQIESVVLADQINEKTYSLPVDAVLFRIGVKPNTDLINDELKLDEFGYIKINSVCETTIKNVYSIGDVANPVSPTISSAAGMGSTAVKAIYHNSK